MDVSTRLATADDIDWLLVELAEFSAFYGTKRPLCGPDEDYNRALLSKLITDHLLMIAERGTERLGLIAGMYTPHFMNPDIQTLSELFWWVAPRHRRTPAGKLLLDAFVQWGRENADWVFFTLEHDSPVSERVMTKRGFRIKESQYLLEV